MATFIFVHGMWHGGWCWKKVAPLLRSAGHEVLAPTLTGLGERAHLHLSEIDFDLHIRDIVAVLEYEDVHDGILVGHSYGGTMVLSIAGQCYKRLTHLVNLDGPLPVHGQMFRELFPDTWEFFQQQAVSYGEPEWVPVPGDWTFGVSGEDLGWLQSKCTPHPLRTWLTPIYCDSPQALALPRTFICCAEEMTAHEIVADEQRCVEQGWQYRYLVTGHDAMLTEPEALVQLLLGCL